VQIEIDMNPVPSPFWVCCCDDDNRIVQYHEGALKTSGVKICQILFHFHPLSPPAGDALKLNLRDKQNNVRLFKIKHWKTGLFGAASYHLKIEKNVEPKGDEYKTNGGEQLPEEYLAIRENK
jgi:hypothetical protein